MNTTKKDDLPAMPFYVGDWLKAPDIQCLSYELKGLWFEMLCYMWESKERGVLLYSKEELSRLLRLPEDLLGQKLWQLSEKGIYSVRASDGAIYSRRMVKDQKIREIRIKAGKAGAFATHFAKAKPLAKCENEIENENEDVNDKNHILRYPVDEPTEYLNQKLGTKFDPKNKTTVSMVKARFAEGRTIDDFKTVIDKKVSQWKTDEKMSQFLRPKTLFNATNFEQYLNEKVEEKITYDWIRDK